ncbi:MAG TPA: carbamoyltransferase HypF [Terriglobales bacterium]|nr:carbamoyltransferase HypF [Terriglobales bacterium]
MSSAFSIRVRGVVQGVGFRPFVYRLAHSHALTGWVLNGGDGVEIHVEGSDAGLRAFLKDLATEAPAAASIAGIESRETEAAGLSEFTIRESQRRDRPTVHISPDLPVCNACLRELFEPANPRYRYPYINCTDCGPRYSVVLSLPYDRPNTTMRAWPLDQFCSREYHNTGNRRFHAQPVACPQCGPDYFLQQQKGETLSGNAAIRKTADLLRRGMIVAVKGIGGYHLACDARNATAVDGLRERKFRKEKPFALMAKDLAVANTLIDLTPEAELLLKSNARPIVLAGAKTRLPQVAPDNDGLGVMLPYTPLQYLLFDAGAPDVLVMTSANRSSEPIAYQDRDALDQLGGIADAFLIGERPIARRVDDSVARAGAFGPVILRRSRGYAPGAVASLPVEGPILAVGADLKNSITLVVNGQAFVSHHIGDLEYYEARRAFHATIEDLLAMYEVRRENLLVVHDSHPQYFSTQHALGLPAAERQSVQHHRAHIASVLAERAEWQKRVLGVSLDGTGYGDDGTIWGGEFFVGSIAEGFQRVAHLRPAFLPGGDAAAQFPVQAAAGFLAQLDHERDFTLRPFAFPARYHDAQNLIRRNVRCFRTTSFGRLFDAAAALLGFRRQITFEGQAAMWLEHLARQVRHAEPYPFPFADAGLDFRPLLAAVIKDRLRGRPLTRIARSFQRAIAQGLHGAATTLCRDCQVDTVVLSGGVFQNELLMLDLKELFQNAGLQVWTNHTVPPNDGGISLGQAALAAFQGPRHAHQNLQKHTNARRAALV